MRSLGLDKSKVFYVSPNLPIPDLVNKADGLYLYDSSGVRYLDTSAGSTSFSILGWNNSFVNSAIKEQLGRFSHVDYKAWSDPNVIKLATVLLSQAKNNLKRVYFSGNSGAEACEAAMKISYQSHYDSGSRSKQWFISRTQSYHGATSDAMSLGERPNLEFFKPLFSPFRAQIPMHHPLYLKQKDESEDEYAKRSANQLEEKILEIGPENVAGFVAETMMGGLVGDVPPAPKYWQYIREICDRHCVHLILDEIYCGTGTSGKIFCCDWDKITPDLLIIGKTLAAGYGALSAVFTTEEIYQTIKDGQGKLQHTTTHQAHSLSVAAALAVQTIIHQGDFVEQVDHKGRYMREVLHRELGDLEIVRDIRGRGLRFSIEHNTKDNIDFSRRLLTSMREKYKIIIDSKWHRVCFTPALNITGSQVDEVLGRFIEVYRYEASK